MKWKKLNEHLEYSKNTLVNGKHMLKFCKQDVVIGLMTDDQIRSENIVYDTLSLKEKEKILAMGFHPKDYKDSLPEKDESTSEDDEDAKDIWKMYPKHKRTSGIIDVVKDDIRWTRCSFDKKHEYATNYLFHECHLLKIYNTDIIVGLLYKMPAIDDFNYSRDKFASDKQKQTLIAMGFTIEELPKLYSPDVPCW